MSQNSDNKRLLIGQINGLFGVQGWVKVFSYAHPRKNILTYKPWHVKIDNEWTTIDVLNGRVQAKTIVANIKGVNDREQAREYIGLDVYIETSQLPKLAKGQYYWNQLIGLKVINTNDVILGEVSSMVATGSNDVMVVKGKKEHWVPYIEPFLIKVNIDSQEIHVDWDENF
ncbi:ribosome maturation factor RimM [Candidatus Thioglobus sp.]|uniref:ribosome maturation factor RimM n=1 Tax=Candidatus Thioglobus sp. TaxID=2026721 RepID=UPI0026338C49|nr:ribosome maturation factor RimM [Candidatus Thioglobus sp.]MDG2396017.1 ribosome maturation factor RimM [Candidatus Thioglobus sp.]